MNNDMGLNQTNRNSENNFRPELMDEEFDNINFKAITDGLGFHHGEQKDVGSLNKAKRSVKPTVVPVKTEKKVEQPKTQTSYMNGLEAFYNTDTPSKQQVKTKTPKKIKKVVKVKPAAMAERSFAYIADLFLIVAFMVFTFAVIFISSGIEYSVASKLLTREELTIYGTILFALNYLLYFTILDTRATPGKLLVGIKIIRNKKKLKEAHKVSAFMACSRAILTLIQLPIFIIMAFKIHDKVLGLNVVNSNEL